MHARPMPRTQSRCRWLRRPNEVLVGFTLRVILIMVDSGARLSVGVCRSGLDLWQS